MARSPLWSRAGCLLAALLMLVLGSGVAYADPSPTPSPTRTPSLHDVWPYPFVTDTRVDCAKADPGVRLTCESLDKPGVLGMDGKIHCDKYGYGMEDKFGLKRTLCETAKLGGTIIAAIVPGGDPITGIPVPGPETVQEAAGWLTKKGLEQLVDAAASSAATLYTEVAKWIFRMAAPDLYSTAYASVYNAVTGVLIALVFVVFLLAVATNVVSPRAEGTGATVGGLVRAVLGISLAAVIAAMMVRLADECTAAFLTHQQNQDWETSGWPKAMANLASAPALAVVALLVSALAIIGLLALTVIMFLRGIMIYAAGIIGAIAMLGQAHPATRSWARQWFFTVTALAWSKFVIAALWVLGGKLLLTSGSSGEGAQFADLLPALSGLALIWLMVYAPFALTRMFGFLDVQASGIDGEGVGRYLMGKAADAVKDRMGRGGEGLSPEQLMKGALDEEERRGGAGPGEGGPSGKPDGPGKGPGDPGTPLPGDQGDDDGDTATAAREAAATAATGVPAEGSSGLNPVKAGGDQDGGSGLNPVKTGGDHGDTDGLNPVKTGTGLHDGGGLNPVKTGGGSEGFSGLNPVKAASPGADPAGDALAGGMNSGAREGMRSPSIPAPAGHPAGGTPPPAPAADDVVAPVPTVNASQEMR